MHVMVDVFASNSWSCSANPLCLGDNTFVTELLTFLGKAHLNFLLVAMLELAVFDSNQFVLVLLWQDLASRYWLDRCVVVVLVDLLVDGSLDLFDNFWLDGLVDHSRSDLFVNRGIMMTRLGPGWHR